MKLRLYINTYLRSVRYCQAAQTNRHWDLFQVMHGPMIAPLVPFHFPALPPLTALPELPPPLLAPSPAPPSVFISTLDVLPQARASLSTCLSLWLPLCVSLSLLVFVSLSRSLALCLSLFLFVYLSLPTFFCLTLGLSLCVSLCNSPRRV